jgi:hypothetical protein
LTDYCHYVPGGGLGDLVRELLRNGALGVLKRWKLEHPRDSLRVVLMSHNPAAKDLLVGQDWIDEVVAPPFDVAADPRWASCYERHAALFEGRRELRFVLPEAKSLYRADMNALRPPPGPGRAVTTIPPVGMAVDVALSRQERDVADFHAGCVVLHPFGGHSAKWFPPDLIEWVAERAGPRRLLLAADYARPGHGDEIDAVPGLQPRTFGARVFVEVCRRARAVVGAESAAYYVAAMWGVPTAMLWAGAGEYRLKLEGRSDWDFYFGEGDGRNLFLPLPPLMTDGDRGVLGEWLARHAG